MNKIVNAAPMTLLLGIQDNSTAALSVQPEQIPTHCPKVFLYTQKGPAGKPQLVSDGIAQMFGAKSFDLTSKYATHQTVLSTVIAGAGNAQMIERMIPADAPLKANFTLWLDVLPTDIPQYQRNADGTYILDSFGAPLPVAPAASVPGFQCKWLLTSKTTGLATASDDTLFGHQVSGPGDQDAGEGGTSTKYPILEFWADSFGDYGNNCGFRIWAPSTDDEAVVNTTILAALKAFPFRMQAIRRETPTSTAKIVPMISGDMSFDFTLEANALNPVTKAPFDLGRVLPTAYALHDKAGFDPIFSDMSGLHIYQANIDTLMAQFYAAEKAIVTGGQDFHALATDEQWMFNMISGRSSTNAPYASFVLNTSDANAIALTASTNLWAQGGGDGTMSNTALAALVESRMADYADQTNELMDTAVNVESIVYDTGFPLSTKQALCNFISVRKDTFVVLSTYTVDGPELSIADEASIAQALRTQLQLFPESSYFGTPVARGLVMARYGRLLGYNYAKKMPITLELASKAAKFMGAGNGVWNKTYLFDRAPASELTMFTDLNATFVPSVQQNMDWANGLNYPLSFSRDTTFLPAIKTVYADDTSVLTSFFTAMACVQLEKVGMQVWREFSGVVSLTEGQLISRVNKSVQAKTEGKFAGLFKIIPDCTITDSDAQRGYSWTLPIQIYANNMKTVMTLSVDAYRMSALQS